MPALAAEDADALAKQLSKPVAALISVPLQFNSDNGLGDKYLLNRAAVDSTFIQPVLSKGLGQGLTAGANRETGCDWEGRHWVVPLNLSLSKVTKFGAHMVSIGGGVRYYLESPAGGPTWGLRFTRTLLFPT